MADTVNLHFPTRSGIPVDRPEFPTRTGAQVDYLVPNRSGTPVNRPEFPTRTTRTGGPVYHLFPNRSGTPVRLPEFPNRTGTRVNFPSANQEVFSLRRLTHRARPGNLPSRIPGERYPQRLGYNHQQPPDDPEDTGSLEVELERRRILCTQLNHAVYAAEASRWFSDWGGHLQRPGTPFDGQSRFWRNMFRLKVKLVGFKAPYLCTLLLVCPGLFQWTRT